MRTEPSPLIGEQTTPCLQLLVHAGSVGWLPSVVITARALQGNLDLADPLGLQSADACGHFAEGVGPDEVLVPLALGWGDLPISTRPDVRMDFLLQGRRDHERCDADRLVDLPALEEPFESALDQAVLFLNFAQVVGGLGARGDIDLQLEGLSVGVLETEDEVAFLFHAAGERAGPSVVTYLWARKIVATVLLAKASAGQTTADLLEAVQVADGTAAGAAVGATAPVGSPVEALRLLKASKLVHAAGCARSPSVAPEGVEPSCPRAAGFIPLAGAGRYHSY